MDVKTLEKMGLTKGESAVYLALLRVGNCTSGVLSKESGVSRSKVYEVIDKREDLDKSISESKKIVKDLKKLQSLQLDKQEAKIYVGIAGWRTLYKKILGSLSSKDEYLAFGIGVDEINNIEVKRFIKTFHLNRSEKRVWARILMGHRTKSKMKHFDHLKYYKYKFTKVKFPTNIAVYKDNIVTLVWGANPVAFVIKSSQVAKKYRNYFESVWEN